MIKFNKNNNMIIPFTILLANRNQDILGEIVNASGVNFTGNLNTADELSFTVNKTLNGYDEVLWDEIYDLRLIYIKELNEYFQIAVSFTDQTYLTKTITATSLCEAELSQTMLYDIEINTELDISRDDYKVAKFWTSSTDPEDVKATILYRVLEKVPAYSVKYVDPSLVDLQRVFTISGKSVYDWLVNDCATEFNCLVKFDSTDRTISFYDLYTYCPVCHTRGIFNDHCTHIITADDIKKYGRNGMLNGKQAGDMCGNENLTYYGNDTTILVSTENLTDEIKFDTDIDAVKNSFRLVAGDDDMTAAVVNINPSGSQYIYNFSPESLNDMPDVLVDAIKEYNTLYDSYKNIHEYYPTLKRRTYEYTDYTQYDGRRKEYETITYSYNYNDLVKKYKVSYKAAREDDLLEIPGTIVGYPALMQYIYQCYDFYSYLESSMMPKLEIGQTSASEEASKLNRTNMGDTVSLSSFSASTTVETVNSAIINYAKSFVKVGFVDVDIEEVTYVPGSVEKRSGEEVVTPGVWRGRFVISDYSLDEKDEDKIAYAPSKNGYLTFNINKDYETYIIQKIQKKIAKDVEENEEFTNLLMINDTDVFHDNICLYSFNRIKSFKDSLEAVLGIMQEANIALDPKDQKSSIKAELYDKFYKPFLMKFRMCEEEMNLRSNELKIIARYSNNSMRSGTLYDLLSMAEDTHRDLDLKKFLDKKSKEYNENNYILIKATPKMTSNTLPEGTVSASHSHNNYYQPFYAFNEYIADDKYTWATTQSLPQWICYKFDSPVLIKKLVTYHRNEQNIRAVSKFTFQGSNDGTSWKTIGTCEIPEKTAHYRAEFDFSKNKKEYLYYRLNVTENFNNSTGTGCGFAEIELYKPKYLDDEIDLYKLLTTYIRQDEYSNTNYISTGLKNDELFKMAQMFYEAATEELLKSSTYQHSISANLYNLLALDEFKPIVNSFELGNWIRVMTDNQLYRLRLISYSVNFDDPTSLNTEFSDVTITGVGYNDLQSILNQANNMATSYPSVTRQAELGKLAKTNINEWVEKGFNSAKSRIMNNDNEEIEINNVGLTAKTFNDITGEYDPQQLRLTHNVLAYTKDNWETISTALGLVTFTYYEPHVSSTTPIEKDLYGLVAEAVMAGWVVGSTIIGSNIIGGHVQNAGNTAYLDFYNNSWKDPDGHKYDDFLHVQDGSTLFRITKKGNFITTGGHFSDPNDDVYLDLVPYPNPNPESGSPYYDYYLKIQDIFSVKKSDGTIMSKGGHFQNADNSNYVDLGNDFYFLKCNDWDVFSVTKDGYLTSTSGYIGGFHISNSYISSTQQLNRVTDVDITLSLKDFVRNMYLTTPIIENERVVSIETREESVNGLRFAVGSYFGVKNNGDIYGDNLKVHDIYNQDTYCRNIKSFGNVEIKEDLDVTGSITCDYVHANDYFEVGSQVRFYDTGSIINNDIHPESANITIQRKFKVDSTGTPYMWVGSDDIGQGAGGWYQLMPVLIGTENPPNPLPTNVIYLQYEETT